jgi:uncharacterized RDD family membrane protein YckC
VKKVESRKWKVESNELEYAGFWPRAGAMVLDLVIIVPIAFAQSLLLPHGSTHPVLIVTPQLAFSVFYAVYLVYRFGGTPGKLIMRLRIARVDGRPVTLAQAFVRHLPELLLGAMLTGGSAMAAWQLGLTVSPFPDSESLRQIQSAAPSWMQPVSVVQQIWIWSELVVMLTNERRRALHDFIAGTVVIRRRVAGLNIPGPSLPADGTWRETARQ